MELFDVKRGSRTDLATWTVVTGREGQSGIVVGLRITLLSSHVPNNRCEATIGTQVARGVN